MFFVYRRTMEAALLKQERGFSERLGAAVQQSNALTRQALGWLTGKANDFTARQMATIFWEWDGVKQAAFFNCLQDAAWAENETNSTKAGAYVGTPTGSAQWRAMASFLNPNGRETLQAMAEQLQLVKNATRGG